MQEAWKVGVGMLVASWALVGCGPPWHVNVRSGPPSALRGVHDVGVSFDTSQLMLGRKNEHEYLAAQDAAGAQEYQAVRSAIDDAFTKAITAELPGVAVHPAQPQAPITLVVHWRYLVMGEYVVVYSQDSQLAAQLDFVRAGKVVDSIYTRIVVEATGRNRTAVGRLRDAATQIGQQAALYVKRAQPE